MHKRYWKLRDKESQRIVKKSLEKFEIIDIRMFPKILWTMYFTTREIFYYALKWGIENPASSEIFRYDNFEAESGIWFLQFTKSFKKNIVFKKIVYILDKKFYFIYHIFKHDYAWE